MNKSNPSDFGRRRFMRATAAVGGLLAGKSLFTFAQDPPTGCPIPPSGGTPFQPGQDLILGSLVNNLDGFRLPYWDWENARAMPAAYRAPAAAANFLWDTNRDSGIEAGGDLPVGDGDSGVVDTLYSTQDFATVGGTASSSGSCELNPHGVIHNDIGLPSSPWKDMGNLGFAARDPIFFAHHANIDKIWANWNSLSRTPGLPAGAYQILRMRSF